MVMDGEIIYGRTYPYAMTAEQVKVQADELLKGGGLMLTREQFKCAVERVSLLLTYPALDDLHALDENDADLRAQLAALQQHHEAVQKALGLTGAESRPAACYVEDLRADLTRVQLSLDKAKDELAKVHQERDVRYDEAEDIAEQALQRMERQDETIRVLREALEEIAEMNHDNLMSSMKTSSGDSLKMLAALYRLFNDCREKAKHALGEG